MFRISWVVCQENNQNCMLYNITIFKWLKNN